MATKNDITGDSLKSKGQSKAYDDGWDRIFGKKVLQDKHKDKPKQKVLDKKQ